MSCHQSLSNAYAVIMAGGRGERFWPASRISRPKQFMDLLTDSTMIEQTVERLSPLFPPERILIVTGAAYGELTRSLFPQIPPENILEEPEARNTAPCIALAAAHIDNLERKANRDPGKALQCIFPSDHMIHDGDRFCTVIRDCCHQASAEKNIVTIGIVPTFPCTGYGYIEAGELLNDSRDRNTVMYHCSGFREKPDLKTAEEYLHSGKFKWNSGMFIMSLATLTETMQITAPELYTFYQTLCQCCQSGGGSEKLAEIYAEAPKISIDYAVMEKASCLVVADCTFDWDDVGSWTSLKNHLPADESGNTVRGRCVSVDTGNCIICNTGDHLIATAGLDHLIVVHTDEITMICHEKYAQNIKKILALLHEKPELKKYL